VTLNLDLASAKAKVARASELLDVLERDLPIHLSQNGPYAVRFSLDQNTGWCEVWLVPSNRGDYRFSLLFGDFIHNLRCALDYIVTALVIASGAQLTTKHQFPIYRQEATYIKDVGPFGSPNPKGLLGNVTTGLDLSNRGSHISCSSKVSIPETIRSGTSTGSRTQINTERSLPSCPFQ